MRTITSFQTTSWTISAELSVAMVGGRRWCCRRQSLAENATFRFKTVFGGKLWARAFDNQQVEAAIKCTVLNRMTGLGMPHTMRML
jgi:hypothetical protein